MPLSAGRNNLSCYRNIEDYWLEREINSDLVEVQCFIDSSVQAELITGGAVNLQ